MQCQQTDPEYEFQRTTWKDPGGRRGKGFGIKRSMEIGSEKYMMVAYLYYSLYCQVYGDIHKIQYT